MLISNFFINFLAIFWRWGSGFPKNDFGPFGEKISKVGDGVKIGWDWGSQEDGKTEVGVSPLSLPRCSKNGVGGSRRGSGEDRTPANLQQYMHVCMCVRAWIYISEYSVYCFQFSCILVVKLGIFVNTCRFSYQSIIQQHYLQETDNKWCITLIISLQNRTFQLYIAYLVSFESK